MDARKHANGALEAAAAGTQTAPAAGMRDYAHTPGDLPEGTLVELLFRAADEHDKPDAFLTRTDDGWQPISHRQLLERTRYVADGLIGRGIERGDRVGLLSENRLEWAVADYALFCTGALTVPVYPTLPANQVARILAHAGARFLFVSGEEQLAKVIEVRAELPDLEQVFVFDGAGERSDVTAFATLLEEGAARGQGENEFRLRAQQASPHDVATLIYTSGTTGDPKGVILTHQNLYSNVVASLTAFPVGGADVALSFLPLSHVLQRMVDYAFYSAGVTIAHVASIDDVGRAFREVKPTISVAVPRVYEKTYARILSVTGLKRRLVLWARRVALDWAELVLKGGTPGAGLRIAHRIADRLVYSKVRERLGGRIRFFVSGGAPLSPQLAYFFYGAGIRILEGYGLTETSPVTNVNTLDSIRVGTVGRPIAGTEIGIAEDGEILVRGPQVMKGYYRNAAATAEAIDADGWFRTGDIGELDDGYLRITDRKKDLLVTAGGKNIAPQPIQNAAKTSRYVSEAVMLGDRRPYAILMVVPDFDALETWARGEGIGVTDRDVLVADPRVRAKLEEDIFVRLGSFARYEMPKKILPVAREFSLEREEITPSLKVRRRVVEANFSDAIEALYAEPARE
jgi:long-chain acyl-CoA synthetase